jgi:protein-tyrosine phosphatase
MADGLLQDIAAERGLTVTVDSAGTAGYHVGEQPDRRAQQTMLSKGHDIGHLRARQFDQTDFNTFDVILAMDRSNFADIIALAPDESSRKKVHLMLSFGEHRTDEVPDPYYGGDDGFEEVYVMLYKAINAFYNEL